MHQSDTQAAQLLYRFFFFFFSFGATNQGLSVTTDIFFQLELSKNVGGWVRLRTVLAKNTENHAHQSRSLHTRSELTIKKKEKNDKCSRRQVPVRLDSARER